MCADVNESIQRLTECSAATDQVTALFHARSQGLAIRSTTEIKKCFSDKKTAIARYLVDTVLQCRYMLELTDKSKPKAYEALDVRISYSYREDFRYCMYNILIELDGRGLLCKTIYAYPNSYVPVKKVDTERNSAKAQREFNKGSKAQFIGGTGVVRGAVVAGTAVAKGANAGQAVVAAATGGAAALEGTKATLTAVKTGTTVAKALGDGAKVAGVVKDAAKVAGAATKTASFGSKAVGFVGNVAGGQGIAGMALGAAGAGLASAGAAVGGTVGAALAGTGAVLAAPATATILGIAGTTYSLYKMGCTIKSVCTWKSKAYRFGRDTKSCISYMVLKQSDSDTGMNFPEGVNGTNSVLVIAEDQWGEDIDTYRMYPLPPKELLDNDFIGLFATTSTGWPADEELLHKQMERLSKLIELI